MPATTGLAAVRLQQRGQYAHGGGLAGPIGAEQPQHRAFRHVEIDAVQCPYFAEGLHQTFGVDGAWHVALPGMGVPVAWPVRGASPTEA